VKTWFQSLRFFNLQLAPLHCGPCQRIKPIYEALARGRPSVLFVGVDTHASAANAHESAPASAEKNASFHIAPSEARG